MWGGDATAGLNSKWSANELDMFNFEKKCSIFGSCGGQRTDQQNQSYF